MTAVISNMKAMVIEIKHYQLNIILLKLDHTQKMQ